MTTIAQDDEAIVDIPAAVGGISVSTSGEAFVDYLDGFPDSGFASRRLRNETLIISGLNAAARVRIRAVVDSTDWEVYNPPQVLPADYGPAGAILYVNAQGVLSWLPIGAQGRILTVSVSGIPSWAPPAG